MFVIISGSIPPVRFGPVETDPPEISISPVTYTLFHDADLGSGGSISSSVSDPFHFNMDPDPT